MSNILAIVVFVFALYSGVAFSEWNLNLLEWSPLARGVLVAGAMWAFHQAYLSE